MSKQQPLRIVLVDDHPVVRDGLRGQLESQDEFDVVGEAGSAGEALVLLRGRAVDVVVTDLRMPGTSGIELIHAIRDEHPEVQVLVLSTYDTDDEVGPALGAGACGYLLKDAGRNEILRGIRLAARGEPMLAPSVATRLSHWRAGSHSDSALSHRELEVLKLVAAGRSNRQIGTALFIGEATVKTHLQHVYAKLGATDRAAAVAAAYRRHLL